MSLSDVAATETGSTFLVGGGRVGALMRTRDWSSSPVGLPSTWPQSLRSVVELLLNSKFPMFAAWGPELTFLYNDAYAEILGAKHPHALGARFHDIWSEIWPEISPLIDAAMAGEAVYRDNLPLVLNRQGFDEQAYFTFSYSPVRDESGKVAGMFCAVAETTETVAAEQALRESETRFRNMADHAPVMMWVTDPSGHCTYLNRRWYEFTGQASGAGEGFGWLDAVHPEDRAAAEHAFVEANAERRDYRVDFRLRRADGCYRWALDAAAARFSESGAFLGYVGSVIDIDDRKDMEQALRASEARLRLALEGARLGTWDWDLRTKRGSWSPRTREILGVENGSDVTVEQRHQTIHPDDRKRVWQELAAAIEAGDELVSEYRVVRPDGDVRWVASRGAVHRDATGQPIGTSGIVLDVTEERLAATEKARREADALYRAYFENTAEALFVIGVLTDGGYVIEDLNPAHQASIGLPLGEVAGKRIDQILPPELAAVVQEHYRHAIESDGVYQYHERFELNGKITFWDTVLVPVRDDLGRIVRLIGSSRDLTAQVATEEQLRQSQKLEAMGSLVGGVAHDINNLLSPIVGGLDLLQRREVGDERSRRLIDGAIQSAERARVLVQRLLSFARRQPLQPVAVDLGALIAGMADLVASTSGPRIRVEVDVAAGLPAVRAEANQLEMAILNLSVNARDAMPDGGQLTIAAAPVAIASGHRSGVAPGRYVRLSVSDTGIGMDEATMARAIEPFFSTKGVGQGTGLGLSMAHGLASQLGGALTIQSRLGLGTSVELWLPEAEEPPTTVTRPTGQGSGRVAGTALVIDDEDLVRASSAEIVSELGYAVVEAESAEAALRLIEQGLEPDLVVTDHLMPGMSGTDLARLLRERRADLKVLVVSGYADADGIAPDLAMLRKPFRASDLANAIAELSPE